MKLSTFPAKNRGAGSLSDFRFDFRALGAFPCCSCAAICSERDSNVPCLVMLCYVTLCPSLVIHPFLCHVLAHPPFIFTAVPCLFVFCCMPLFFMFCSPNLTKKKNHFATSSLSFPRHGIVFSCQSVS